MSRSAFAYVKKFNRRRYCIVELTESAQRLPADHVYESVQLYWIERPEDEYGWHHFKDKPCAKITRESWLAGVEA